MATRKNDRRPSKNGGAAHVAQARSERQRINAKAPPPEPETLSGDGAGASSFTGEDAVSFDAFRDLTRQADAMRAGLVAKLLRDRKTIDGQLKVLGYFDKLPRPAAADHNAARSLKAIGPLTDEQRADPEFISRRFQSKKVCKTCHIRGHNRLSHPARTRHIAFSDDDLKQRGIFPPSVGAGAI